MPRACITCECGAPLSNDEIHYYGGRCENCEAGWMAVLEKEETPGEKPRIAFNRGHWYVKNYPESKRSEGRQACHWCAWMNSGPRINITIEGLL